MAESVEAKEETRKRRPLLFGANPRINFARLGIGGWVVLLGLIAAGVVFYRYVVWALYYAAAASAYGVGWCLDRLLSGARFPDAPWIGWALSGAALGAAIGFFAIAPVYGLRRWRWTIVGVVLAAMVVVALLPTQPLAGPEEGSLPDRFGPVVRVGGRITQTQGHFVVFEFAVFDQAPRASVRITIDKRGGRTFDRIRVGRVQTGEWLSKKYRCRLLPGKYRYTVTAVDAHGHRAVHEGRASLTVRAR